MQFPNKINIVAVDAQAYSVVILLSGSWIDDLTWAKLYRKEMKGGCVQHARHNFSTDATYGSLCVIEKNML
jgi:hypothetical protein